MTNTNIEAALFSMTINATRSIFGVVVTRRTAGWEIGRIDGRNVLPLVEAIDAIRARQ